MGKTPYQAALDAADEIGLAVVATSATIIAVFLPVSFMGGMSGQYFQTVRTYGRSGRLLFAVGCRSITPVIAAFCLKPEKAQSHWMVR
jgi:multidrug efflux pump subunit AcrB